MSIRRSLAFSFLERYASTAINLGSTLVLARLLSPEEIGVFSVGAAVVGTMHTLRDFGVTNYLIQEREVDREKLRTAFTVTLGLSWLFALVLLAGSGWAAEFYREPGIHQIVWVMAANFALIPFGSPILALMRRELQFGRLAAIQVVSTAVNAGVGIALAATGHGFMSLAWASLAGVATTSALAFLSRPHAFLFRPGLHEWRSVLAFGGYASTNALVGDLRQLAPDLILGRMLGFEAVGLYSRAGGLLGMFSRLILEGLQPVLLPALAERVRRGEPLRGLYLRAIEYVSALFWPFLIFVALMAKPLVEVLLGGQWLKTAPLIMIMSVSGAIGTPVFITQPILISLGKIRTAFMMNLVVSPIIISGYFIGSFISIEAVAIATVPTTILSTFIILNTTNKYICVSITDILFSYKKSAAISLLIFSIIIIMKKFNVFEDVNSFSRLLIYGTVFFLTWLSAVYLTNHPLKSEISQFARNLALYVRRT